MDEGSLSASIAQIIDRCNPAYDRDAEAVELPSTIQDRQYQAATQIKNAAEDGDSEAFVRLTTFGISHLHEAYPG